MKKCIIPILRAAVRAQMDIERNEIVVWFAEQMLTTANAKLRCVEIGLACGLTIVAEKNLAQWAKHFGVSKQAVHKGVVKIRRLLKLRKSRAMRSDTGAQSMSDAYHDRHNDDEN